MGEKPWKPTLFVLEWHYSQVHIYTKESVKVWLCLAKYSVVKFGLSFRNVRFRWFRSTRVGARTVVALLCVLVSKKVCNKSQGNRNIFIICCMIITGANFYRSTRWTIHKEVVPPLLPWVVVCQTGGILASHCTCIAGLVRIHDVYKCRLNIVVSYNVI